MRALSIACVVAVVGTIQCSKGAGSGALGVPGPHGGPVVAQRADDEGRGAARDEATSQYGQVEFEVSCADEAETSIETGLALLHHMMYETARFHFEEAAETDPECAMARWGIAMTSFQPLWHPTSDEDLARGKAAVAEANSIGAPTQRERLYIAATEAFFTDPDPPAEGRGADHEARVTAWREAQRELHEANPDDVDAAALYALSQVAYAMTQASPETERDYRHERRAGALLETYLENYPNHPGLHHYLIHAYDNPALAPRAERVARRYDRLAPEVPHALHMPSHIFVRLGQWEEVAEWNVRSARAALRQPVDGMTSLHYPHALDYMMYAYLQLGQWAKARETLRRVEGISNAQPNLAAAYGIAAARARYALERRQWQEAAELEPRAPEALEWEEFPAAEALIDYARGLGAARTGELEQAEIQREQLEERVAALREAGDDYWATMTQALAMAVDAWIRYERGETDEALTLMSDAADLEDSMDKHPTTPGEIYPVRELYGELLLREDRPAEALAAFKTSMERTPNRRNARHGAQRASEAAAAEERAAPSPE